MSETVFATSGTTGPAVEWLRTEEQLRDEVRLVGETLLGRVDHVVSYAPTEHLYGRLYAEVLPRLAAIPVEHRWRDPYAPLRLPTGARTLIVCLPSTWQLLARSTAELARHGQVIALHSTGPATPAARRVVARLRDTACTAVELLGSTETGAVAHRRIAADHEHPLPWRLLRDVRWPDAPVGTEHRLRVSSPRLARRRDMTASPDAWELSDLVVRTGERSFEHVGRASRLIKVNGRRCDLADVEELVRGRAPGLDVACVAVADPFRGEHYELYYASTGAGPAPADLRTRLAGLPRGLPAPRAVHRVRAIPRSATGKVRLGDVAGARSAVRSGCARPDHDPNCP
ncbi:acyl-CoA synthetase [Streptomyces caatingaensis]|uniref:Acyl-CoA synthetase n=1 Tax=Streptomyces caatingaensis TaxID=1678637 RepID=A0A0K9XA10_9ACTN|nr:acyl-CoA synthetase [Streptomyces caatingaensis]KNB50250.1 acyl-CoA synthetase [Streptomyces caatingaensis]